MNDIFSNLANSLLPVQKLISGGAYVIGCAFIFKAIFSLKVYGESKTMTSSHGNIKEPLIYLFVGGMLVYFPTAVDLIMQTTFGYTSILQYAPVNSSNPALDALFGSGSSVGGSLTTIIQVIGLAAFVRGWILIARSASQGQPPGGTGKGLMPVMGGILAINIVGTLQVLNNTLYGSS